MLKTAEKPHLSLRSDPDLKLGFLVLSSAVVSFIIALKFISGKKILIRFFILLIYVVDDIHLKGEYGREFFEQLHKSGDVFS